MDSDENEENMDTEFSIPDSYDSLPPTPPPPPPKTRKRKPKPGRVSKKTLKNSVSVEIPSPLSSPLVVLTPPPSPPQSPLMEPPSSPPLSLVSSVDEPLTSSLVLEDPMPTPPPEPEAHIPPATIVSASPNTTSPPIKRSKLDIPVVVIPTPRIAPKSELLLACATVYSKQKCDPTAPVEFYICSFAPRKFVYKSGQDTPNAKVKRLVVADMRRRYPRFNPNISEDKLEPGKKEPTHYQSLVIPWFLSTSYGFSLVSNTRIPNSNICYMNIPTCFYGVPSLSDKVIDKTYLLDLSSLLHPISAIVTLTAPNLPSAIERTVYFLNNRILKFIDQSEILPSHKIFTNFIILEDLDMDSLDGLPSNISFVINPIPLKKGIKDDNVIYSNRIK
jgi:hypothetical protein